MSFRYQFPGYEEQSECMPAGIVVGYRANSFIPGCMLTSLHAGAPLTWSEGDNTIAVTIGLEPSGPAPMGYNSAQFGVPVGGPCVPELPGQTGCVYANGLGVPECQIRVENGPRRLGDRLDGVLTVPCELFSNMHPESTDRPTLTALEFHGITTSILTRDEHGDPVSYECPLE